MSAAVAHDAYAAQLAARVQDYVAAELRRLCVEVDEARLALAIGSALDAGVRPSPLWLERR